MRTKPHGIRRIGVAAAWLSAAVVATAVTTATASAAELGIGGAPQKAEVRFEGLMGVPPEGYSLFCNGLGNCSNRGVIDLTTEAEVPVAYNQHARATRGVAALHFDSAEGDVSMSFTCAGSPDPYESKIAVTGTKPGELEISRVSGVPDTNTLAVTLNPAGDSGSEFPQEIVDRSDGGCGSPVQKLRQTMGTWYHQFWAAHQADQREGGNVELKGLTFRDGVFSRTYERFVTIGAGAYAYPTYERTRIEVEPEYCKGKENRILSATANGQSLGVDNMQFFAGQKITAPPRSKIRLGDGSVIELEKGGSFEIHDCAPHETGLFLGQSLGSLWVHVKRAIGGPPRKFDVTTKRAVAGVRGTIFEVRYDKAKELTRVAVEESSVSLKGRNGAKGKVIVKAGQVGVQKGTKRPKIVRR